MKFAGMIAFLLLVLLSACRPAAMQKTQDVDTTILPSNGNTYLDPAGWYTIALPSEWKIADGSDSYIGTDGFFETGYLSEMMFMPHVLGVCQWLANIETTNTYAISLTGNEPISCRLDSLPETNPQVVVEVVENRSADFSHRFFYIRADTTHAEQIIDSLAWLRPVDDSLQVEFHKGMLRPEDTQFWEAAFTLPLQFSVTEYELSLADQEHNPATTYFLNLIPPEAPPLKKQGEVYYPDTIESVNQTIQPYGYNLRQGSREHLFDLYQNETLVLQNIYQLPDVYVFPAGDGESLVFFAHILKNTELPFYAEGNSVSYLIQDETMRPWQETPPSPMDPGWAPIWVSGKPLFVTVEKNVNVKVWNDQHEPLFSFLTYFGASVPLKQFQEWDQHWILGISNFLVLDGKVLNEELGFEEVFGWLLVNSKPVYFFRKGPRVGISYDGHIQPIYYHQIAYGICCGLSGNNPMQDGNTFRFFGERDGVWYYVIAEAQ